MLQKREIEEPYTLTIIIDKRFREKGFIFEVKPQIIMEVNPQKIRETILYNIKVLQKLLKTLEEEGAST